MITDNGSPECIIVYNAFSIIENNALHIMSWDVIYTWAINYCDIVIVIVLTYLLSILSNHVLGWRGSMLSRSGPTRLL